MNDAEPGECIASVCAIVFPATRSRIATRAPAPTNATAIACPMPEPPPVTMATRPLSRGESVGDMAPEVCSLGIVVVERLSLAHWPIGGDRIDDRPPARITARKSDNGPVASIKNAAGTKAFAGMVDV